MTTAPPPTRPGDGAALDGSVVRKALLVTLVAGVAGTVAAALAAGAPAAAGAGLGVAAVCLFFGLGTLVVGLVSGVSPVASLLVALLTYGLQVLLMGVLLVALNRSGALERTVDAGWLAATLIVGTFVWSATLIHAHTHSRRPLYDLPVAGTKPGAR